MLENSLSPDMKQILILALSFIPATYFSQCEHLVWSDEFDGTSVNTDNWSYELGDSGWGNNEWQFYTDEESNAEVSDGTLKIVAREEQYQGANFTSARLRTRGKVDITTGRIEARIKVPTGQGIWPAFWMLPSNERFGGWPLGGEIDIMELVGHEPDQIHGTIHFGGRWPFNQQSGQSYSNGNNWPDEFHIYGVEWKADEIVWTVDGVPFSVRTPTNLGEYPWRFDRPFHFLLNVAVGGNWPGYPDETTQFPQVMEVDYVRVYQNVEDVIIAGDEQVIAGTPNSEYIAPNWPNATYTWSVEGGTIDTGQGTPTIEVDWGVGDLGTVTCALMGSQCEATLERQVDILAPDCEVMILDADGTFRMPRNYSTGSYITQANLSQNDVNSSANCVRYQRNAGDFFDVLNYTADWLTDGARFLSEDYVLRMDVRTNAPAGTPIELSFERNPENWGGFPSGRHSQYTAVTTVEEEWETLTFPLSEFQGGIVSNTRINELVMMFNPNTYTGHVYFIDNIRIADLGCIANSVKELSAAPNWTVYPMPNRGVMRVAGWQGTGRARLIDSRGREVWQDSDFEGESSVNLPNGVYILQLEKDGYRSTSPFIFNP